MRTPVDLHVGAALNKRGVCLTLPCFATACLDQALGLLGLLKYHFLCSCAACHFSLGFGGLLGKTVLGNVAFFTSYAALCNWMEPPDDDGEPKAPSTTTALVAGGIANMLYYAAG